MAYNGDGTFSLPYSWVNDASNGIAITASRMDTQFNNCVTGFDTVICRDGQSTISADIPWGGFKITGLGAPTTVGDALSYGNPLGTTTITSASANALAVGANGTTNPILNVDASTSSVATGINLKGAAAAGGFALSVLSSGTDENLTIDAKGDGTITLGDTSTGNIITPRVMKAAQVWQSSRNAFTRFASSTPTATTSATTVQMGLGSTWVLTPSFSGRVRITVTGWGAVSSSAATAAINATFGTGSAPANAAAKTGTYFSTADVLLTGATGSPAVPFCITYEATGLSLGTPYWFDLTLTSDGSATAAVRVSGVIIEEL